MRSVLPVLVSVTVYCLVFTAPATATWSTPVYSIDSVNCIEIINGRHYSIRHDLYVAMDTLRFCTDLDCDSISPAPETRMVIVLQNSPGLCANPSPEECCTAGDGSGNCARNDPGDIRIDILHEFIDSIRTMYSNVRIGLIIYSSTILDRTPLLRLEDPDAVSIFHGVLEAAACRNDDNPVHQMASDTAVNTGLALEEAIQLVDDEYDSTASARLGRHIILISDGSWDDIGVSSPLYIYENYVGEFPDRGIPTVHAVFIHDSLLHVQHDYPAQGCHNGDVIDLSYLEYAAIVSNGLYFPLKNDNSFQMNFTTVDHIPEACCWIINCTITNLSYNNRENRQSNVGWLEDMPYQTVFKFSALPLVNGENILSIKSTTGCYAKYDTIIIHKSEPAHPVAEQRNRYCIPSDEIAVFSNRSSVFLHTPLHLHAAPACVRIYTLSGRIAAEMSFKKLPEILALQSTGAPQKTRQMIGIVQIIPRNGEKPVSKMLLY